MRRCVLTAVFSMLLPAITLSPAATAAQLTYQVPFSRAGESLWGPFFGIDPITTATGIPVPMGNVTWGPISETFGEMQQYPVPEVCIPFTSLCAGGFTLKQGYEYSANTSGNLTLSGRLGVEGGHVDVSYPIAATLNVPDAIAPGSMFTISSSFSVDPAATLKSTSPAMSLAVDAVGSLTAQAGVESCSITGGCQTKTYVDYLNAPVNGEVFTLRTQSLVDIDKENAQQFVANLAVFLADGGSLLAHIDPDLLANFIPTYGFERLAYRFPDLDIAVGPTGNRLEGSKDDAEMALIRWDLDGLTTALLCSFPASIVCSKVLELDLTALGVDLSFILLDLDYVSQGGYGQSLAFEGRPRVSLDLGLGGPPVEFALGESVDIPFPADAEALTITPTFLLPNTFTNRTELLLRYTMFLKALQASIHVGFEGQTLDLGLFDFTIPPWDLNLEAGPLVDTALPTAYRLPVFIREWEIDGFASIAGDPLVVQAQASVPEPATHLLLLTGLAYLGWRTRRRAGAG
jgi:hypothetical protein